MVDKLCYPDKGFLLQDCTRIHSLNVMKQISDVEEKLYMSSLNICPEACCRKRYINQAPLAPQPLPQPITNRMDIRWQVVAFHTAVETSRTYYSFLDAEICLSSRESETKPRLVQERSLKYQYLFCVWISWWKRGMLGRVGNCECVRVELVTSM
jgi:hypothetical protein